MATCNNTGLRQDGNPLQTHVAASGNLRHNHLLAALPEAEWARWSPQLEAVDMPAGSVLHGSGARLTHAYFPTTAIVSLQSLMNDGASVEIAVVGREGFVGTSLLTVIAVAAAPDDERRCGLGSGG
jgi:hypothetical protein